MLRSNNICLFLHTENISPYFLNHNFIRNFHISKKKDIFVSQLEAPCATNPFCSWNHSWIKGKEKSSWICSYVANLYLQPTGHFTNVGSWLGRENKTSREKWNICILLAGRVTVNFIICHMTNWLMISYL